MSRAILARRSPASRWDLASAALLVALLALVLGTFRDYGISWDEPVHVANGEHLLRYYASGFTDRAYRDFENLYLYGGFYDLLHTFASRPLEARLDVYDGRHLLNGLFSLLGVAASWWLARRLSDPRAGFFAALMLASLPTWQGHAFNNPKDMPFAVMHALSLCALLPLVSRLEQPGLRPSLLAGLTLGLTIATRVGGLLLLGYLSVAGVVAAVVAARAGRIATAPRVAVVLLVVSLVAAASALVFWPWLLEAPLANLRTALQAVERFPRSQPVLYLGQHVYSTDLPWHYLPVWLAIQTPLPVLGLLLIGVPVLGRQVLVSPGRRQGLLLVAASVLVPIVVVLLTRPVLYDAARHFLFLLPPLAVLAALGLVALLDAIQRRLPATGSPLRIANLAAVLLLCVPFVETVRLHPYEYVYFNSLVGGVPGASRRFELDYWGHSLREASLGLASRVPGSATQRVFICGPPVSASHYFPPNLRRVREAEQADFAIILRRAFCNLPYRRLTPLLSVEREGVALSYVYDVAASRTEPDAGMGEPL